VSKGVFTVYMRSKHNIFLLFLFFLLGSLGIFFYQWSGGSLFKDTFFKETIEKIDEIHSYVQHVESETTLTDRHIRVVGDYYINNPDEQYLSFSTTTLSINSVPSVLGEGEHVFTLKNISLHDDVYINIETTSEFLLKTIPYTNAWEYFTSDAIPQKYTNIAFAGPVVDNLKLFSKTGKYVTVIEKRKDEVINEKKFTRYTLKLSDYAFEKEGTDKLGTLVERIGRDGTIDIWIQKDTMTIQYIEFKNPPYKSKTTISSINSPPPVTAPPVL